MANIQDGAVRYP